MAQRFEDLVAWQLARERSAEIHAATDTGPSARDFKFRDQIRDAASSAMRCIAEGSGRESPGDFARFLRYARGSLAEARSCLIEGRDKTYFPAALTSRLLNLERATDRTTRNLMLAKLRQAATLKRMRG